MTRLIALVVSIAAPFWMGLLFSRWIVGNPHLVFLEYYSISPGEVPASRILVLGSCMLAGVLASVLADELAAQGRRPISITRVILQTLRRPHTWTALVVSPLVFYGVYAQVKYEPDSITALLLAFQNGFFWQNIIARMKRIDENGDR